MARLITGKKPKDLRWTLSRLASFLSPYRAQLLAVALFLCVQVAGYVGGMAMVRPVVNTLVDNPDKSSLLRGVVVTAALFASSAVSALVYSQVMLRVAAKAARDMRSALFNHVERLPVSWFDSRTAGDCMSLFTNDMDAVAEALNTSLTALMKNFLQLVSTFCVLLLTDWRLTLVVAASYVVMVLHIRRQSAVSRRYYKTQQEELGGLDGFIQETVSAQKVVKVFVHEEANKRDFAVRNDRLRRASEGAQGHAASMIPAVVSLGYLTYALVALAGAFMVDRGVLDFGALASFLVFTRQSTAPVNQFTQQVNILLSALAGAERVFRTLDEEVEGDEGEVSLEDGFWTCPDGTRTPFRGRVVFDNVTFGYAEGHPVLRNVSFTAEPGTKTAIVGATGAGKTTISNLLERFYEIWEGSVTIDSIDIRSIRKADLRKTVGIVLQDTRLFSGTVADNIRFGNPDASDAEVEAAAGTANATSFISRLPNGCDTPLRGDGDNLSQGQRQLISIARTACANPPVLVLDEATSSVDTLTEELITAGMDHLMEGRTVFVIAHRLSTVKGADQILVVDDDGRIVERGDHASLMAAGGVYHRLRTGMREVDLM